MAHYFTLPETYNPAEFGLPRALADPSRWLVSTIVRKMADRQVDERGLARLSGAILQRVCHRRYADIVRALDKRAIETDSHIAGQRTKGYRLTMRYLSDRHVRVACTDPMLADRIQRERERMDAKKLKQRLPIHEQLDAIQRLLSIDDKADDVVTSLKPAARLCQDILVGRIRNGEHSFSVADSGRCFNSITSLARPLRPCLRLDGEPLGCVDIREAQPALLGLMMIQNYPSGGWKGCATYRVGPGGGGGGVPADVLDFCLLVSAGSFYKSLGEMTGTSRAYAKKRFLVDVLAKRGGYPSSVEDAFKLRFPSVWGFIQRTNRKDHAELIRRLQTAEAELVIHGVAPRLVGRIPVLSLHDALYGRLGDLDAVEQAFKATCDTLGFSMAFKRE